jgi:hypothetical protein
LELKNEVSPMRVLSNHMFVAHKRQEQNHQQELGWRKRGRRRGATNKIVPIKNPPSGGGGPEYDLINLMQENQYDIGRRGCALMSSLLKANWDRQTARRAGGHK